MEGAFFPNQVVRTGPGASPSLQKASPCFLQEVGVLEVSCWMLEAESGVSSTSSDSSETSYQPPPVDHLLFGRRAVGHMETSEHDIDINPRLEECRNRTVTVSFCPMSLAWNPCSTLQQRTNCQGKHGMASKTSFYRETM